MYIYIIVYIYIHVICMCIYIYAYVHIIICFLLNIRMCLGKPSYSPNISTIIYMVWSGATCTLGSGKQPAELHQAPLKLFPLVTNQQLNLEDHLGSIIFLEHTHLLSSHKSSKSSNKRSPKKNSKFPCAVCVLSRWRRQIFSACRFLLAGQFSKLTCHPIRSNETSHMSRAKDV